MEPSTCDQCIIFFPFTPEKKITLRDYTCLQTDDALGRGNNEIIQLGKHLSLRFTSRQAQYLNTLRSLRFNKAIISIKEDSCTLTQPWNIAKIKILDEYVIYKAEYISQRARRSYVAAMCRSDAPFGFSMAIQVIEPERDDARQSIKYLRACSENQDFGLRYIMLDHHYLSISLFVDASFANIYRTIVLI